MVYLVIVDMSFSQDTDALVLVSAKLRCQILFKGISDATKIGIYHAVAIENSEGKKFLKFAVTDMRNFARSKFSKSLVYKKKL